MEIVTNQMFENQFLTGLEQNLQSELSDTEEISTGHRVNQPSDDPAALVQIVGYKTQLSDITGYQNAITIAKAPLQSLDTSLSTLNNTLERANELAISSGSGTTDPQSMKAIADEVQQLSGTAVNIANTNVSGQYIFAGDNSNVNPINPNTGELLTDNNSITQNIGVGVNVTTNVPAGSLFSFARVNGNADSITAVLPTYNWANSGANTIPDADPVSALETAAPTTYVINPGDYITVGGVKVVLNPGASPVSYNASGFANKLQSTIQAQGGALAAVTVSYSAVSNKFTIANAAALNVTWGAGSTTPNIEQELGFVSAGNQSIDPGLTSDYTVGAFNSSDNILTANGGAFDIKVGNAASSSNGAFVINNTNNKITTSAGSFTLTNGVYSGSDLASALSAGATGLGINVNYDSANHKFSITSNPAVNVDWTVANNIGKILGFSSAAVQAIGTGITSDNVVGDVNLAAGSTLQDARDAINTAGAGVKAQVVNVGTSANPDLRIVVASDPAGNSAKIDISTLSTALTTTGYSDPSDAGINMLSYDQTTGTNMTLGNNITNYNYITQKSANDSVVIDNGENGNIANNQIQISVNIAGIATPETVTIPPGTYTNSGSVPPLTSDLASAMQTALNSAIVAAGGADTYTVTYDPNAQKFSITGKAGNADALTLDWSAAGSTARQLLGFNATDTTIGAADIIPVSSDNSVLANYYSFNNNYLNDKYVLRALNFEQVSLQNNDAGRVQQAIQYTSDLTSAVSQTQSQIGATEDKVNTESSQQMSSQTDIEVFLSNTQDTDLASTTSDLSLKQTALQALRTITTDVLSQSLFDFIKPS